MLFKNVRLFLLICVLLSVSFGCKKNDSNTSVPDFKCTTCTATPQAIEANNSSSKGIYKGVVVGSTGTIVFDVLNSGSTITAKMVIDGVTVNLVSSVTWQAGQPYTAPFTGTYNGNTISITFSVGLTGSSPTVNSSNIPGHPNASFTLVKETSTSLIECFEGSYHSSRPEDGVFNLILSRSAGLWGAAARTNAGTNTDGASGSINANNQLIEKNGTNMGTISGDAINGTFKDNSNNTVTITGKRTL